jgi:hypothetical protein
MWIFAPARRIEIGEAFSTIGDALATGCLLAGLQDWLAAKPAYLRFLRSGWFAVVPLLGIAANAGQGYALVDCLVGQTVLNLAIALCIDRCRRLPDDRVGRLLETRPVAALGVLSYSLYLWQQPFLNRFARSPLTTFPLNLLLVFAAAVASYGLIERPLLAWRKRLR